MNDYEEATLEIQAPIGASRRMGKVRAQIVEDDLALLHTMESKEGRRTLWRVMQTTGYFEISYTGNSETYFREGKRLVGKLLYDNLQRVCPDLYTTMHNENKPLTNNPKENGNA